MTSLLSRIFSPVARCADCGRTFRLPSPSMRVTVFDKLTGRDEPVCPGCENGSVLHSLSLLLYAALGDDRPDPWAMYSNARSDLGGRLGVSRHSTLDEVKAALSKALRDENRKS